MGKSIIAVENLKKYFNNKIILDINHLDFQTNKIFSIVGPNGSGKTTLLKILNLLEKPDAGRIFFYGEELNKKSNIKILNIKRKMTLIEQNPFLFSSTVYNNIAYGLKIRAVPAPIQREMVKNALKRVGLSGFEERKVSQLSGGEAKRVVIARGIVINPDILLLDELTANIDQQHQNIVEKIIRNTKNEIGSTIIFTTHDLSQAYRLSDEVISLLDGKIIKKVQENLFKGLIEEQNGIKTFRLSGGIKFFIVSDKVGSAYISIDPKDIILSHYQFQSSARNSFLGKITKIIEQNHLVKLEIDVGVSLVTIITKESFQQMNLNLGKKIYLTIKASALKVY